MRIEVDPVRIRAVLNAAFIAGGSKPLLDTAVAEFDKSRLLIKDISIETVAVYATYRNTFFKTYDVTVSDDAKQEIVPLPSKLLETMNQSFKKDNLVTFRTEGNDIFITGEVEKEIAKTKMPDVSAKPMPPKFSMELTKFGWMPPEAGLKARIKIPSDTLSLPDADKYTLSSDGKDVRVLVEGIVDYSRVLKVEEVDKLEEFTILLDKEHMTHITDCLAGPVWLAIWQDYVAFAQMSKEHAVTFFMTTRDM